MENKKRNKELQAMTNYAIPGIDSLREVVGKNYRLLLKKVRKIPSREQVLSEAAHILEKALCALVGMVDIHGTSPGHGTGHMARDCFNAFTLAGDMEGIPPEELFIGILGGVLHDAGCFVIPRYEESKRAIRHAEMSAILVRIITDEIGQIHPPSAIFAHLGFSFFGIKSPCSSAASVAVL